MTVSTTESQKSFDGNGATTEFSFTFPFFQKSDLVVVLYDPDGAGATQNLGSDYTIPGVFWPDGGQINMTVAPESGYRLVVSRVMDLLQQAGFRNLGEFRAEVHEDSFDKIIMILQQQQSDLDRSLKSGPEVETPYELGILEPNKILELSSDGVKIISGTIGSGSVMSRRSAAEEDTVVTFDNAGDSKASGVKIDDLVAGVAPSPVSENKTLTAGQTVVTLAIPLDSFYTVKVSNAGVIDGQELFKDVHFSEDSATQITLFSTYPAGTLIQVSQNAYHGEGQSPSGSKSYYTFDSKGAAEVAQGLANGSAVEIPNLGNAKFNVESSGTTALTGDILNIYTGQVYKLQSASDGSYNVEWFGASGLDKLQPQDVYFNLASDRAKEEVNTGTRTPIVTVPGGNWLVENPITNPSTWVLQPDAVMYGNPSVYPSFDRDTSNLTGTVITYSGSANPKTIQIGDPNMTVQKYTGKAYSSEITANSSSSSGAITGTTYASESATVGAGCIAGNFIAVADNPGIQNPAYALYLEAYKTADADPLSTAWCMESTIFNDNTLVKQSPNNVLYGGEGSTYNLWLTTGGQIYDQSGTPQSISGDTTMAIGIKGKQGSQYETGIQVKADSIRTKELISAPRQHKFSFYGVNGTGTEEKVLVSFGEASADGSDRGIYRLFLNSFAAGEEATAGWVATYNAQYPAINNQSDIGLSTNRVKSIYLQNSPDVSSDETLKEQRSGLSEDEINAAVEIARLPKMFKWLSEIAQKGEAAYLHCSPMAQSVWAALESNGLDPTLYGFVSNEDGALSIKPQEILWMICAAQQTKLDDIEMRLAALEV